MWRTYDEGGCSQSLSLWMRIDGEASSYNRRRQLICDPAAWMVL